MLESGFIELKLDCPKTKSLAVDDVVLSDDFTAGRGRRRAVLVVRRAVCFRAHRAVLAARSPVFKAQLRGSMADDAKMPCITLHDIQPATFRILLWFMYTDELPGDEEELRSSSTMELWQNLLAAAGMYRLDRLKLMCAQKLWEHVSTDTVATILCCAEMQNSPELKNRCLDFFVVEKNFKKAVLTEGYLQLLQISPAIINEIRAQVIDT
ncbi:BTB/POZ and MATH domain-containing protein 1-like [Phragmites australis]|uniref:BTB/POZ and MATH domain-containing protein 1-like n=1 Tax=Phragmites australis TaxID=29695 RepID=UPI002D79A9C6|nr:BTB/POZ and MATH domain-containing protein 1-like [Phragmites australis]